MSGTTIKGGYVVPNIKDISAAYGLAYFKVLESNLSDKILMDSIFTSKNCIIEYVTEGLTAVSPKLEYNKPIEMPIPMLPKEEQNLSMFVSGKVKNKFN